MNLRRGPMAAATALLVLGSLSVCLAQNPVQAASAPGQVAASPVSTMKKTVIFLEADCIGQSPNGSTAISPHAGTAFLLGVGDPRLKDRLFTYIVTNRHVAQPGIEDEKPCNVVMYQVRADTLKPGQNGSFSSVQSIPAGALKWSFSPDPSVDLAISSIGLQCLRESLFRFLFCTVVVGDKEG